MVADEARSEEATAQPGGLEAVGARLASAREQQQLKLEAVASELHLRPEVVQALETGDAAQLPSQPFVRGYVKSYARLLGLDDGALLEQLPRVHVHSPAPLGRVGMPRRRSLSLPLGRLLVSGLVVVGVVVVGLYAVPAVQRLWLARTAEPPSDELLIPLPDATETAEPLGVPLQAQPQMESEEPAVEAPTAEAVAVEESASDEVATPSADEPPLAGEPQQTAEESAGPAVVQLRFMEDSWVEMEANGRKLVVGTQRAGSERTVRVEPPVHLLLGNAPGVEVSFRGKPVDVASHQRGKVARLTLED